ncbi:hypothetical protein ACFO0N_05560 [Halobium salinum]|uniref:Uncharacterized protein n=1 Tax=Halobium salinum TaxID=1364940 RepID=A0ABD5P936_9EURY|nr:hypothetical protein [Halobium salinum]
MSQDTRHPRRCLSDDHDCPDDADDPAATTAYRWLRVAKLLLGALVSLLTALQLLGMLP